MSDIPTRSLPPEGDARANPPADALNAPTIRSPDPGTFAQTPSLADKAARMSELTELNRTPPALPEVPGYALEVEIGAGGMGIVYRAKELAFDRDVALKLLNERYSADSPAARRFLGEARITGQLQHPAIPPVHHIGTLPDGRPFLAMKLIKGDTLADLLVTEPDNRGRHVAVFAQVCQAIAYAHSRAVIHRDLKPSNVMVGAFGEVQVMDWGLAKVLGEPSAPEPTVADADRTAIRPPRDSDLATEAGSVLGTPPFMAPEQAQGAVREIDERADVFGLGAVLCVILTGKPPYSGPSTESIRLMAIRGETADAVARLDASGADAELVALAKRCLATDREARPRNAGEVAKAVAAHLAAAEERARQAELDRVRAEGERATAEAKAAEEANTRREADARLAEARKRRRAQLALTGAVVVAFTLSGFGVALAGLWRDAEGARAELESANGQLTAEKKQTDYARKEAERQRGLADAGRAEEERLRRSADKARDDAITLKRDADAARDDALRLKGIADKAQAAEEAVRKQLEVLEYGRTIQVAHQEWRDNNIAGARALLEGTKPELRGWEWHYVHRLCHADLLTLKGHIGPLFTVAYSPDGSRIVTAGDISVRVWDAKKGTELFIFTGHKQVVFSAAFNADGTRVVSASGDGTVKVWDAKSGEEALTLKVTASAASFNGDGSRIVTANRDKTATVWDAKSGEELLTLKGHTGAVNCASFSRDGSRVMTRSGDTTVKVWDGKTGAELVTIKAPSQCAAFSGDASRIATADEQNTIRVWDARTGKELLTLKGHTGNIVALAFSPDGSRIVSGSADNIIKVWDARVGLELLTLKGHTAMVMAVAVSPDGSRIVTGSVDKTARIWDVGTRADVLHLAGGAQYAFFLANGSRIIYGSNNSIAVRGEKGDPEWIRLKMKAMPLYFTTFSPDGTRIVTSDITLNPPIGKGPPANQPIVWDAKTGEEILKLKGHTQPAEFGSFSPDGSRVVTTSTDRTAKVWDVATGTELMILKGHEESVHAAAFSPDGSRIITASGDGTAKVWDAKTGGEVLTLKGHTGPVNAASFSADGSRIVTAGHDKTVKLWDARTGTVILTMKGHTEMVLSASFSPDGSRIITGSQDRTAKVWDTRTGAELLTLKPHHSGVKSVAFSPDGWRILTVGADVKLWDARPLNREFLLREPAPAPREK